MLSLLVVVSVLHDHLKARATVSLAEFGLIRVWLPQPPAPLIEWRRWSQLTLLVPNKDAQCKNASILGAMSTKHVIKLRGRNCGATWVAIADRTNMAVNKQNVQHGEDSRIGSMHYTGVARIIARILRGHLPPALLPSFSTVALLLPPAVHTPIGGIPLSGAVVTVHLGGDGGCNAGEGASVVKLVGIPPESPSPLL